MIITTTPTISGETIVEYKGLVFGATISGINFLKDMAASFRNTFGGRSASYEKELEAARQNAISEMRQKAYELGADAIVGVTISYESLGEGGHGMLMVTANGTAVVTGSHAAKKQEARVSAPVPDPPKADRPLQPNTVMVDRSQPAFTCPVCGSWQTANRSSCSRCGTTFVDKR